VRVSVRPRAVGEIHCREETLTVSFPYGKRVLFVADFFPGALYPLLHSSVTLKKILRKSKIGPMIDSLCTR